MEYDDFELEVGEGIGGHYPVVVLRSWAGEARQIMHFPFGELELQNHLLKLEIALLQSTGQHRAVLTTEEHKVQEFGKALYDALISGEVRSRFDVSLAHARDLGRGLRIKLRIQGSNLSTLPWEYLYDDRQHDYVCLRRETPIVRYLEMPEPIQGLKINPPLRILGLVVSPDGLPRLDIEIEKQRVEEALQPLKAEGLVELEWLKVPTWRHLQSAMQRGPWHILHFVGHGGFDPQAQEGLLALADEANRVQHLRASHLRHLLEGQPSLRLVVLNACEGAKGNERDAFSSMAATLVREGIPATLAMQYKITDRAAIEFSRAFYAALANGLPVDATVAEARKAVKIGLTHTLEWGTPVLYMRARDGVLFKIGGGLRNRREGKVQKPHASTKQGSAGKVAPPENGSAQQSVRESDDNLVHGFPVPLEAPISALSNDHQAGRATARFGKKVDPPKSGTPLHQAPEHDPETNQASAFGIVLTEAHSPPLSEVAEPKQDELPTEDHFLKNIVPLMLTVLGVCIALVIFYARFERPNQATDQIDQTDRSAVPGADREAYEQALTRFKEGDLDSARRGFAEFLVQHPHSDLAPNAQFWLGESYYIRKDFSHAIDAYNQVQLNHPTSEKVPAALLKKAYAYLALEDRKEAASALKKIIDLYPSSPEANKAMDKLNQIKESH